MIEQVEWGKKGQSPQVPTNQTLLSNQDHRLQAHTYLFTSFMTILTTNTKNCHQKTRIMVSVNVSIPWGNHDSAITASLVSQVSLL